MIKTYKLIHIEDDFDYSEIFQMQMQRIASKRHDIKLEFDVASSVKGALQKIDKNSYDCIVCDHQIIGGNGIDILTKIKTRNISTPFIFLTGQGDEQVAREAFVHGANDYFTKDMELVGYDRIYNSIKSNIEHFKIQKQRKEFEDKLMESEKNFGEWADLLPISIYEVDNTGTLLFANKIAYNTFGYTLDDFDDFDNFINISNVFMPEDIDKIKENIGNIMKNRTISVNDYTVLKKDGTPFPIRVYASPIIRNHEVVGLRGAIIDNTKDIEMQEKLREEVATTQRYIDIADIMVISIDLEGYIIQINKKGCEILGYEKEELLGINYYDSFIPISIRDKVKNIINIINLDENNIYQYNENIIVDRNGEEKIIAWHNAPLKDKTGKIIGTLCSGEDITTKKKLEEELNESQERLKKLIVATKEINILDKSKALENISDKIKGIVPYDRLAIYEVDHEKDMLIPILAKGEYSEEVLNHSFLLTEGITGRVARTGAVEIINDPTSDADAKIIPKTPLEKIEYILAVPLIGHEKKILGVIDLYRDYNKFDSTDKEVVETFAAYTATVLENAKLYSNITEAKKHNDMFISILAHDLKNPLAISMAYAEMLNSVPDAWPINKKIYNANTSMVDIIENVLLYVKLEAGEIKDKYVKTDLNEVLFDSILEFKERPKYKNIHNSLTTEEYLINAIPILRNAFTNLIDNALKYGDNCEISIEVKKSSYVVRIKDKGEGIPDNLKPKLFKKFERIWGENGIKGTGLGLSIVKYIVNLHNGKVWVEDDHPHGCVFLVELPKA